MSDRKLPASDAWSPLDFEQETSRATAAGATLKRLARNGVRTFYGPAGGSGTADLVRFDEDIVLTVINCVLPSLARWHYDTDEPLIMLRASLCCDVAFQVQGGERMLFDRPEVTLACVPAGRPLTVDVVRGVRQQGIVAIFRASAFARRYGLRREDLPASVRDALSGTRPIGRIASFPLDHRIAGLIAETIDSRLEGEMLMVQYGGRLAELVAYTFDAMRETPALVGPGLQRQRDVDLAYRALRSLERNFRDPPLFAELAREIGTNQNKLKALFKEAFGVTMADYCLERRIREAQQLLLEATLSIAQVAELVGYQHQSSFTAAFRGHLGMSPSDYRRHRAPFILTLASPAATGR